MFVCQCRAVTDRQVRGAVAEGCESVRAVAATTGAGTVCGGCIPTVRDMVCSSCPSRSVALACDDVPESLHTPAPIPLTLPDPVTPARVAAR